MSFQEKYKALREEFGVDPLECIGHRFIGKYTLGKLRRIVAEELEERAERDAQA